MGWAIDASTTLALAPGYRAVTETCGGTISGNWATGMREMAMIPASVMTTAITIASRGRSKKMDEGMAHSLRAAAAAGTAGVTGAASTAIPGRTFWDRKSTRLNA